MKTMLHTLLLFLFLFSCSKHERINPFDPNSSTWLPWQGAIADTSIDINDTLKIPVFNHTPSAISSYMWTVNSVETTTTKDSLTVIFTETGTQTITMYTLNKNLIPSEEITAIVEVTQSKPILTSIDDTIINGATEIVITPEATDTNATGSIVSYFWYPQNNPGMKQTGPNLTITNAIVSNNTIIWGATDDDGLETTDTFIIRFNKAPVIDSVKLSTFWYDFDHSTGTGSVEVIVHSSDPDTTLDLLQNSITTDVVGATVSKSSDTTLIVSNLAISSSLPLSISTNDTVGGLTSKDTTITLFRKPAQIKVFAQNSSFIMGDNSQWKDNIEQPRHTVRFSHDLWVDSTEISQTQFDAIASTIPGYTKPTWEEKYGVGDSHPAYRISWEEAILFCNARSKAVGLDTAYTFDAITGDWGSSLALTNPVMNLQTNGYRLPTEAEWEYLCRGNTESTFFWGESESPSVANNYSWNSNNSNKVCHPVAEKTANAYGLYDMCGNVSEWCWDYFSETYYSVSPELNPTGPTTGSEHSVRGGGRHSIIEYSLRSGARESSSSRSNRIGFRTVRTAEQ